MSSVCMWVCLWINTFSICTETFSEIFWKHSKIVQVKSNSKKSIFPKWLHSFYTDSPRFMMSLTYDCTYNRNIIHICTIVICLIPVRFVFIKLITIMYTVLIKIFNEKSTNLGLKLLTAPIYNFIEFGLNFIVSQGLSV